MTSPLVITVVSTETAPTTSVSTPLSKDEVTLQSKTGEVAYTFFVGMSRTYSL